MKTILLVEDEGELARVVNYHLDAAAQLWLGSLGGLVVAIAGAWDVIRRDVL
jgi:hypothetical protein